MGHYLGLSLMAGVIEADLTSFLEPGYYLESLISTEA